MLLLLFWLLSSLLRPEAAVTPSSAGDLWTAILCARGVDARTRTARMARPARGEPVHSIIATDPLVTAATVTSPPATTLNAVGAAAVL
eukprot:g20002.t1